MRLRPFFSYFGSKWRLAPRYPMPLLGCPIIEPFAGSAAFSLYHHQHQIKLYDKYSVICELWDYLINVSEREILSLPLLDFGEQIPTNISQGAQHLIGFWVTRAATRPRNKRRTKPWSHSRSDWSAHTRSMIANQVQHIRHWSIEQRDYASIELEEATWFVDPPYEVQGHNYVCSEIDYQSLSQWVKSLRGQTIICENSESNWLPTSVPIGLVSGVVKTTHEVMHHTIKEVK